MPHLAGFLVVLLCTGGAVGQDLGARLQAAQASLDAGQWQQAVDQLLLLRDRVEREEDMLALAAKLREAGDRCVDADDDDNALRARTGWLSLRRRMHGERDHDDLAAALGGVADCLSALGRAEEALPLHQQSLAMQRRLCGDGDHADVAMRLHDVAHCLERVGQTEEALLRYDEALAMRRRLHGDGDHASVAQSLNSRAHCLLGLGRDAEALPQFRDALAMRQRLHGGRDHLEVAYSLNNVAFCLRRLGRAAEALPMFEASLAMRRRLHGDRVHPDVAACLANTALCLRQLGRLDEALTLSEQALAMTRRVHGDRDHPAVVPMLDEVASCLHRLGRLQDALVRFEEALAMSRRLHEGRDHPQVAAGLHNLAGCLSALGRGNEALAHYEESLAMIRRRWGDADHPDVASGLASVAFGLSALGRDAEALPLHEAALAMRQRLHAGRDHPQVAASLNNLAHCLQALGRAGEALPLHEATLAMRQRLHGDRDHPQLVESHGSVGFCLQALGRAGEALPRFEVALAMAGRLHGDSDHPSVALSQSNVAFCLQSLGRPGDALPRFRAALAMEQRLYGDRDHPGVATTLANVASCLGLLGRPGEALPLHQAALAMRRRLHGEGDQPDVAASLANVAACLRSLDRAREALPLHEQALAMWTRVHGDGDHADVVAAMTNVSGCLGALGELDRALPLLEAAQAMARRLYGDRDHPSVAQVLTSLARCHELMGHSREAVLAVEAAISMIERLRDTTHVSAELRQSFFESLKGEGAFELGQRMAAAAGLAAAGLHAAERSRGRDLLDALQQLGDPEAEARQRARLRGDEAAAARLAALRTEIEAARTESDRLLHELTRLADRSDDVGRGERRAGLLAESDAIHRRLRPLLDERARLLGDALPGGRVRTAAEIQGCLRTGELLLEYTLTASTALLYVVSSDGAEVVELPQAFATTRRVLPRLLQQVSRGSLRGRDPEPPSATAPVQEDGRQLFLSLLPAPVWEKVRTCRRVFVAAHRELHRVPFELLAVDVVDGRPVPWLDRGPPIAYVPSGSVLHWLRQRAAEGGDDAASLDLLAIGDPRQPDAAPEVPERGVFVAAVADDGEGARVGLRPGDVLLSYDGKPLADDEALRDARLAAGNARIPVTVWRRGEQLSVEVRPGALGIHVGPGAARAAWTASLGGEAQLARQSRAGDLERIRQLAPLREARAEAEAIAAAFGARRAEARHLLGVDATEPVVFDLAAKARYLHFACHGIAEEYAGQSLSMLVLSQPDRVQPGDDGLLQLGDLWHSWRGRLVSCRLVVLSACRTNVGPTGRDEAPQALPLGFLFAGAPAVISTLWPVDDASTRELMTDFYGRLLAGETDKLAAFTAAKQALRGRYSDPFHWAPFLYIGAPD